MTGSRQGTACNIDARGRRLRRIGGGAALVAALALAWAARGSASWALRAAPGVLAAGGLLGLYEARRGWCVARAAGLPTPF
jgi:hypothetical protein